MLRLLLLPFMLLALGLAAPTTPAAHAQAVGTQFFEGTWQEALAEAKRTNKLLWVDCYTTWCGPCRWMAAQTFPAPEVGRVSNAHFVAYKIDCERGEGPRLCGQFGVRAFPTIKFVNPSGQVVGEHVGALPPDKFAELLGSYVKKN